MNSEASILATLLQGASPAAPGQSVSARQWRILVVDDDVPTQRLEFLVLSQAGYAVDTAADGEDAWAALLTGRYDLLLTDHNMPRLSGLDLVRRIRAAGMRLPVIINSGGLDLAEAPDYPQLDLAAVLDKSRGFPELMEVVRHLLPWPPDAELEPIAHVPPAATAAFPAPRDRRPAAPWLP